MAAVFVLGVAMTDLSQRPDIDYPLWHALQRIKSDYGKICDITSKFKTLRKFGRNQQVGQTNATVMDLPTGETEETLPSANVNVVISSTNAGDTQNLTLIEGHTVSGTTVQFQSSTTPVALTGQTSLDTGLDWARVTRARLSSAAVGTIYIHEGGATTGGVPDDLTTVHAIIAAGETQTQKASTSISSGDFWILTDVSFGVLEKQTAYANARVEIQPINDGQDWYPISQWVAAASSSGTSRIIGAGDAPLIVPSAHDVRVVANANAAATDVVAGMSGFLARVDRDA